MMDLFDSALGLAQRIRQREISVEEAVRHCLERIDRLNPGLGAVVSRRDDRALAEARAADSRLSQLIKNAEVPPFFGVPILIKDLTEVAGDPVSHGSRAFKNKVGQYDATVIGRILGAGFIHVGRTNSPEFGSLPVTENLLHAPSRNPFHTDHTPGGSSGGAAAAVASKMVPLAHGSDGGGSIRIPASCCGLVGLKAQRARVPKGPWITEILHGISTDGCLSHTVQDTALFMDQVSFRDPDGWFGIDTPFHHFAKGMDQPLRKLKIAYTTQPPIPVKLDVICLQAMEKTLESLRSMGHEVFEVKDPWNLSGEELLSDFIALWASAGAYMPVEDESLIEPFNLALRQHGLKMSSFDYVKAISRLQLFSKRFLSQFRKTHDILVTPTLAIEPPPLGWHYDGVDQSDVFAMMNRACSLTPFTCIANITGQPALSLPSLRSPRGLPIGVHLLGLPMDEVTLLQVGRDLGF